MITVELPPAAEKRLQELAERVGRTKEDLALEAIAEHIEDLEDAYIALERLKTDDGVRIPLEDVMRVLDALEAEENGTSSAAE